MAAHEDLAWYLHRLTRGLVAKEIPVLSEHGLSLWAYVVLSAVTSGPAPTQLALAAEVAVDKTKMVAILDELETAGLVSRRPDPIDRRAKIVEITDSGRDTLAAARADIRGLEDGLLAPLEPAERTMLRAALAKLVDGLGSGEGNQP